MKYKNFSVCLITPPQGLKEIYGKFANLASSQPAIGVCALGGYLLREGISTRIIDADALSLSIKEIIYDLKERPPNLVGIYTHSVNYPVVVKIVEAIRAEKLSTKIVLGGPHMNFAQREVLIDLGVDFSVKGEGEETLCELSKYLFDGSKSFDEINGLAFKDISGEIIVNKPRVRLKALDELPFPAVNLLPDLSNYKPYFLQYKRLPFMPVETSRGCPYACSFCETPFGKKMGYYSPEYIVDYIKYLQKNYGVRELHFIDDTFTLSEKRVFDFCELVKKENLDITWYCNARVDIKNKSIWKSMKEAGCWLVAIGVEAGNQDIIYNLQKGITVQQVRDTAADIRKSGMRLKTFFIIGNPGETKETIEETIELAISLKAHYPVFSLMTPYPGTPLWNSVEKWGEFDRESFDKLLLASEDPTFVPYGLTKDYLLEKQKAAFKRAYVNFGMAFRQLGAIRSFNDLSKLPIAMKSMVSYQLNWY